MTRPGFALLSPRRLCDAIGERGRFPALHLSIVGVRWIQPAQRAGQHQEATRHPGKGVSLAPARREVALSSFACAPLVDSYPDCPYRLRNQSPAYASHVRPGRVSCSTPGTSCMPGGTTAAATPSPLFLAPLVASSKNRKTPRASGHLEAFCPRWSPLSRGG